jgi:hypothetical protein
LLEIEFALLRHYWRLLCAGESLFPSTVSEKA